jgi:hypothetical protein
MSSLTGMRVPSGTLRPGSMNRSWPVSLGSQLNGNLCRGRRIMTSGPFTTLSFAAAQRQAETRNGRAVRRSKVF